MNTSLSLSLCSSVKSTFFFCNWRTKQKLPDSLFVVIVSTSALVKAPHRGDQSSVQLAFTSRRWSLHSMTKGKKTHCCLFCRLDLRVPTGVKKKGSFLGVPLLHKDQTEGGYRPKTRNGEKTFLLLVGSLLSSNHRNTGGEIFKKMLSEQRICLSSRAKQRSYGRHKESDVQHGSL